MNKKRLIEVPENKRSYEDKDEVVHPTYTKESSKEDE
jgi:hypothetical protein